MAQVDLLPELMQQQEMNSICAMAMQDFAQPFMVLAISLGKRWQLL
jgi:hypothetical protein